jgi:hypothetical protein
MVEGGFDSTLLVRILGTSSENEKGGSITENTFGDPPRYQPLRGLVAPPSCTQGSQHNREATESCDAQLGLSTVVSARPDRLAVQPRLILLGSKLQLAPALVAWNEELKCPIA